MNFSANITRNYTADVAVIGGGTAGVFAAISAAKSGADTLLIEKNSMLGGTLTVASVNYPAMFFAWGKQIIDGPCWEAVKRCDSLGGAIIPDKDDPEYWWKGHIRLNNFTYLHTIYDMCREAGVRLATNTMLTSITESDTGCTLVLTDKEGLLSVECKNVIDATGDATATKFAGYQTVKSEEQQPATLQTKITGYDNDKITLEVIEEYLKTLYGDTPEEVTFEAQENEFTDKFFARSHSVRYTAEILKDSLNRGWLNIHTKCVDADTSNGRTELEAKSLDDLMNIYKVLRGIPGCENLTVSFVANETGVRETCRIVGEKTVTGDDYINGVTYPDAISNAYFPIDVHVMGGVMQKFHQKGVYAKVPYGALIPKGSKRIIVAGRCISSDRFANSGLRVEATCMSAGQAAGCAAAISAKEDINFRDVDYTKLCSSLKNLGAIVPNNKE